jgi:lipid-binding SYLF domain-containing protein
MDLSTATAPSPEDVAIPKGFKTGPLACSSTSAARPSAGLALESATLRQDLDDNDTLYGKKLENRDIVTKGVRAPKAAAKLIALLNRYSTREHKD